MAWPKKYCGLVLLLTYIITFADYVASSYLPPRITYALTLRKENVYDGSTNNRQFCESKRVKSSYAHLLARIREWPVQVHLVYR